MSEFWIVIIGFCTAFVMNLLTGFYRLRWSMKDFLPIALIACGAAVLSNLVNGAIAELLELEREFITIPLILILIIGGLTLYKEIRIS